MAETVTVNTFQRKLVTVLNAPLTERGQVCHFPHSAPRDPGAKNAFEGMVLESFDLLVLAVGQHGMVYFHHIVSDRSNHAHIHFDEVLRGETIVPQVAKRPITLPEPALHHINVCIYSGAGREVPAQDLHGVA